MMKSETLRDRLLQVIGLIVLAGMVAALIFAFREKMLPQQEEGDVFGTVYAITSGDVTSGDGRDEASASDPADGSSDGSSDLSSEEEG